MITITLLQLVRSLVEIATYRSLNLLDKKVLMKLKDTAILFGQK
jgi:hypothetical protein